MTPILRDYQVDCVNRIRAAYADGARCAPFQLPTGGGKTVVFSHVLASRRCGVAVTPRIFALGCDANTRAHVGLIAWWHSSTIPRSNLPAHLSSRFGCARVATIAI